MSLPCSICSVLLQSSFLKNSTFRSSQNLYLSILILEITLVFLSFSRFIWFSFRLPLPNNFGAAVHFNPAESAGLFKFWFWFRFGMISAKKKWRVELISAGASADWRESARRPRLKGTNAEKSSTTEFEKHRSTVTSTKQHRISQTQKRTSGDYQKP